MAIRYTFARVISTLNKEAIRALPDAITGSTGITFASAATIADANSGFDAITGSAAITLGSAADITPSIGVITGSAAITVTTAGDVTPSPGVIAGSAAVSFGDVADITPAPGGVSGSAAIVFNDAADITPSVGSILGSAAIVVADPATTINDANSGLSNITGSAAIVVSSAADITPSVGDITGAAAGVFSSAAAIVDALSVSQPTALNGPGYKLQYRFENRLGFRPSVLTANVARFYGLQRLIGGTIGRLTSTADITPAIGSITGSAAIISGQAAVLEDANAGTSQITGSAAITFGSQTTLDQIGLVGTGAIVFAGAGDLTPSRGRLRGQSTSNFTTSASLNDAGVEPGSGVGIRLNQQFRRWGYPIAVALQPRYTPVTSLGAITGSTTITFAEAAVLDGVTSLTGSAAIAFGDSTTLINVGGPGTVSITGSASITFSDTAGLVDISLVRGTTIIRFRNSASAVRGRTRLVSAEPITFTGTSAVRANAKIEASADITLTGRGDLDNIGVELIYGTSSIAVTDNAVILGRYVSWIPEGGKSGSWTKESGASDGWNKETSVSDTWVKEAS